MEGESNMEDSIERIREDIDKEAMEYWGCYDYDDCESCPSKKEGGVCEAHGSSEPCRALMIRDLLRRQRELCERGAR